MVTHILWGAIRTQPQGCSIVSWLLLSSLPILSLSWLTNIGISLLELREGHGGWTKPIFYKKETGDTDTLLCPGAPQCPAQLHSLFSRFPWLVPLVCTPLHVCARAHAHAHTHTHTHTHTQDCFAFLTHSHSQACAESFHFSLLHKLSFGVTNTSCLF